MVEDVTISVSFIDQCAYSEVIEIVASYPSVTLTFNMEPLVGSAFLNIYSPVVEMIVGKEGDADQPPQFRSFVSKVLESLETAWASHHLSLSNVEVVMDPRSASLTSQYGFVVMLGLSAHVTTRSEDSLNPAPYAHSGQLKTAMTLCFPISLLKPLVPALSESE